mmetsp:Transcript_15938/g.37761  ORF Transcript_15938/g.37761 Transcript_15938/m.37761 type:complete len:373 (+) Transcript_15938:194-1312(+)
MGNLGSGPLCRPSCRASASCSWHQGDFLLHAKDLLFVSAGSRHVRIHRQPRFAPRGSDPADVPAKDLGPEPVDRHEHPVAGAELAVGLVALPEDSDTKPEQRADERLIQDGLVLADVGEAPLVAVVEAVALGEVRLRRERGPAQDPRQVLPLLVGDLRSRREAAEPGVDLAEELLKLLEGELAAHVELPEEDLRLFGLGVALHRGEHLLHQGPEPEAARLPVQKHGVLGELREVLAALDEDVAELAQLKLAVAVRVALLEELSRPRLGLLLGDGPRVAEAEDGPVAALHPEVLVGHEAAEVVLGALREGLLDLLHQRVHLDARRPDAGAVGDLLRLLGLGVEHLDRLGRDPAHSAVDHELDPAPVELLRGVF